MTVTTLTTAADALKTQYMPRLRMQLNDGTSPVLAALSGTSEFVQGNNVVHGLHVRRSSGSGARPEGGQLPTAHGQGYDQLTSGLKALYGAISFSGHVFRRAAKEPGVFVNVATNEMVRLEIDLKHDLSRMLYNDANQYLIRPSGTPTGQVLPVAGATVEQYLSIIEGMRVDIGTTGVAADQANSVVIASVNETAETLTFTGTISSVDANGYIRKEDNFGNEFTGLRQIIASGDSLFGVDGASVRAWNSYVATGVGTPTELAFQKAIDKIAINSGAVPRLVVTTHGVHRNIGTQMKNQRRYTEVNLNGGFTALAISSQEGTANITTDRFCPAGTAFLISPEHLVWNRVDDWKWADNDGSIFRAAVDGTDGWTAYCVQDCELTTDKRNAHGKMTGLTELN